MDRSTHPVSHPWFARMREHIEMAHQALWSLKASGTVDDDEKQTLKYALKAFRRGASIVGATEPKEDESHEAYCVRVSALIEMVPDSVALEDVDAWRSGIRELVRAMQRVAG